MLETLQCVLHDFCMQDADDDIQTMARMKEEESREPSALPGKPCKRKSLADPDLSTPRPRKLQFQPEASEVEDEPHVPTPTSSPGEEEASDGEDHDLFVGRFAGTNNQSSQPTKIPQFKEPVWETPPSKKAEVSTPGKRGPASRLSGTTDDLQGMLASMDDKLLDTVPATLCRQDVCMQSTCMAYFVFCPDLSDDYRYFLAILQIEDLTSYADALDCLGPADCLLTTIFLEACTWLLHCCLHRL